jgi:hypothetical protein
MRRWLLDLHLYLGLLCLPYVVVFGVSSILLNHGVRSEAQTRWQRTIAVPPEGKGFARAEAARDALELWGGVLAHTVREGDDGALRFKLIRPGRAYQIVVAADGEASVVETNTGVLGVVSALHAYHDARSSFWGFTWALYTELAVAALLFAIASGTWLVWPRASGRALELAAGLAGALATAALAVAIW